AMRRALGRGAGLFSPPFGLDHRLIRLAAPALRDQLCRDLVLSADALARAGWRPEEPSSEGLGRLVNAAR
uniref:hypothetical protein n=1 Tax=Escherichia coli TaxID=562 RepID=UPI001954EB91